MPGNLNQTPTPAITDNAGAMDIVRSAVVGRLPASGYAPGVAPPRDITQPIKR
jgi:hypothetical protein